MLSLSTEGERKRRRNDENATGGYEREKVNKMRESYNEGGRSTLWLQQRRE
jgi:hypothetical protein